MLPRVDLHRAFALATILDGVLLGQMTILTWLRTLPRGLQMALGFELKTLSQ